jgi:pimeloyl-ACP methyl ester carboxylesterase
MTCPAGEGNDPGQCGTIKTPDWFRHSLQAAYEEYFVDVEGVPIEARSWGEKGKPGLMLVHGAFAHLGWWSFLAPFFAKNFRVTCLSFSGMGRSGWRESYRLSQFAREINAVAEATGVTASRIPPILVGHSMGGSAVIMTAALQQSPIRGVALVDTALPLGIEPELPARLTHNVYSDFETALARFRLLPAQPIRHPWIFEELARKALIQLTDGNWTWTFDPRLTSVFTHEDTWELLNQVKSPLLLIRGERSPLTDGRMKALMLESLPPQAKMIEIPDAHHHVMIDEPIALVAALRTFMAQLP